MSSKQHKIKFTEMRSNGSIDSPQYSLAYPAINIKDSKRISYELLSKLKGDSDVVLEFNSSFSIQNKDDNTELLDKIRALGLDYTYRKITVQSQKSIFSMILGNHSKTENGYELIVFIQDNVWKDESIQDLLPQYGARYYFTRGPEDGQKLIEMLSQATDSEKLDHFKIIAFNIAAFGQTGIVSNYVKAKEIKDMVGISR